MARVRVIGHVTVGAASVSVPVKRVYDFAPVLHRSAMDATATQLRVIAEEVRELILDKLFAGPLFRDPPGAERRVNRPKVLRRSNMMREARRPYRHPPLAERTRERKANRDNALDGRKLIETGAYVEGIEVLRTERKDTGVVYRVRPAPRPHEGFDPNSGPISHRMLARVHEFGSQRHNIPARPHWGPAIRAAMRTFDRLPWEVQALALREALRGIR